MKVKPCTRSDLKGWLELRKALWPDCTAAEHEKEMGQQLAEPDRFLALLASHRNQVQGFAEASLRHDFVNGTDTSPVAFLEGLYVAPEFRRQGVAHALVEAVADWARKAGVSELASDTGLDNRLGQRVHRDLGFEETERVVYFRMSL